MRKTITLLIFFSLWSLLTEAQTIDESLQTYVVPKHQISVSGSYYSAAGFLFLSNIFPHPLPEYSTGLNQYGCYNVEYLHNVNNWFAVGGGINVQLAQEYTVYHDTGVRQIGSVVGLFSVMSTARFSYIQKPNVTLYSAISLGYLHIITIPFVAFNATLIGTTFGNEHVYGLVEFNIGTKGIINAGIGYRF